MSVSERVGCDACGVGEPCTYSTYTCIYTYRHRYPHMYTYTYTHKYIHVYMYIEYGPASDRSQARSLLSEEVVHSTEPCTAMARTE